MINIGPYKIGFGRTFIIAEAGINHNGKASIAKQMVDGAIEAGADAIKFQSFRAETMCDYNLEETKDVEKITGGTKSSYEMYKALELSDEAHIEVFEYARKKGILCFSSVFDFYACELLVKLKSPVIKISSGDVTYFPLIEKAVSTGLPIILSTGMATLSEIAKAYEFLMSKNAKFMLLHCISQYPTPYEDAHLSFISTMKHLFNCPIGFSDHGEGTLLSETAVALGACIIEKHFTLDKNMDGPDQKLSADIPEFSSMVKNIRNIEKSLGNPYRNPTMSEFKGRHDGRRGIKAGKNLKKGSVIKPEDLKIIKPQTGILPEFYNEILGKKLLMDVDRGNPINWNAVE